ncbi:MAG: hypothetical protein JWQ02_3598 [Capsulimonas sp.]|nr:hypothetical protein [Capsulimonas sp.]
MGLLVGCITGAMYGFVKGIMRPIQWAVSGSSIWGAASDALQKQLDYGSDIFDWCLTVIGSILTYAIYWSIFVGFWAFVVSGLVRFAVWIKKNLKLR